MKQKLFSLLVAALLPAVAANAASPWRVPVHFSHTDNAGVGYSWFVVGNHPDLGNWDVLKAAPLAWHDGDVWSADIGIQAGTELEYKFVKRPTNAADFRDGNKTEWWPDDNLTLTVDSEPAAPFAGKRVVFICDWPEPVEFWFSVLDSSDYESTNEWQVATMTKTGDARYEIDGIGEPGQWMRFTFHQPDNDWWYHFRPTDDEETDFWCPLDGFCVRDGQVFDYEPVPIDAGWVSGSRIISTNVGSSYPDTIAGREIRIYLPRGYDENTDRRYPVIYMSDGQQIFSDNPDAAYGSWKADLAANREIRAGHMREAIIVGVPCREGSIPGQNIPGTARLWEYLPGTDCLMGIEQYPGLGTDYARFLVHNVKPTLDWNFRTLTDRDNTAHVGSSAGGLLSFYLGTHFTSEADVFGLVGALSGVYTEAYIPNLRRAFLENPALAAKPKRIWLDTGTEETNIEDQNLYASNWDALTLLLYGNRVSNKSLHFGVYIGDAGVHNEAAWAARIADVFDFLMPVTDEFNPLLPRELALEGNSIVYPVFPDSTPSLVHVDSLVPPASTNIIPLDATTDHPWATDTTNVSAAGFYFLSDTHPPRPGP